MKKENIIKIILLFANLFVFVSGITILLYILIYGYGTPPHHPSGLHFEYLVFFTTLSNVFASVVSGIILVYLIKHIKEEASLPKWLSVLHLASTTSLTLTMMTVICFLGPTQGFDLMYKEDMLFYHLIHPLLTILSFFLFKHPKYLIRESLYGIIPMGVYGIFYSTFVLTHVWDDFYGFTFGGKTWAIFVVLPIMLCVTYLFSFGFTMATKIRKK